MFSEKYRPSSFDEVIGQPRAVQVLERVIERAKKGELPTPVSLVFAGPHGTGKTSCARIVDTELTSCGNFWKHVELNADFESAIKHLDGYAGYADNTIYIFETTDLDQLPSSVVCRSYVIPFSPIYPTEVYPCLEAITVKEGIVVTEEEQDSLKYIANVAEGDLRRGIDMLDELVMLGDFSPEATTMNWPIIPVDFAQFFLEAAQTGDIEQGLGVINHAYSYTRDAESLWNNIIEELTRRVMHAESSDDKRKMAVLIEHLWLFRAGVQAKGIHPIEGFWFTCYEFLSGGKAKNLRPVGFAQFAKPTASEDARKLLSGE